MILKLWKPWSTDDTVWGAGAPLPWILYITLIPFSIESIVSKLKPVWWIALLAMMCTTQQQLTSCSWDVGANYGRWFCLWNRIVFLCTHFSCEFEMIRESKSGLCVAIRLVMIEAHTILLLLWEILMFIIWSHRSQSFSQFFWLWNKSKREISPLFLLMCRSPAQVLEMTNMGDSFKIWVLLPHCWWLFWLPLISCKLPRLKPQPKKATNLIIPST